MATMFTLKASPAVKNITHTFQICTDTVFSIWLCGETLYNSPQLDLARRYSRPIPLVNDNSGDSSKLKTDTLQLVSTRRHLYRLMLYTTVVLRCIIFRLLVVPDDEGACCRVVYDDSRDSLAPPINQGDVSFETAGIAVRSSDITATKIFGCTDVR